MDLKQLIEFKQSLVNDLISVKHDNAKLRVAVSKRFSNSVECVLKTNELDEESLVADFYDYEQKLVGHDLSTYSVFVPRKAGLQFTIRSCKGCGQQFKTNKNGHSLSPFYEHCIRDCEEYKKLNLIRSCDNCQLVFVNSMSYGIHVNSNSNCELSKRHRDKPDWAPKSKKQWNGMHTSLQWNTSVYCEGCGQQFRARRSRNGLIKEIAFYRHCFDECDEYKKLNKIQRCSYCNGRVINVNALHSHYRLSHENNGQTP